MKTVTFLSQKGGSGKSTLAQALAVHVDQQDQAVMVIDLDPQSTTARWFERRESDTPYVAPAQSISLPSLLDDARNNDADMVIIDTAPHSNSAAISAVKVSDLVLIPCRPSMSDLDAIENSINLVLLQQKEAFILLNAVPPNAPRQVEDVTEALESNYNVKVLPLVVHQRSDFVHALPDGKSPTDYAPYGKAAAEIANLYNYITTGEVSPPQSDGFFSKLLSRS